jgi:hypothetical protein
VGEFDDLGREHCVIPRIPEAKGKRVEADLPRERPTELEIDIERCELRVDWTLVPLGSRAFDIAQVVVALSVRFIGQR